jgi:hypothetical protein
MGGVIRHIYFLEVKSSPVRLYHLIWVILLLALAGCAAIVSDTQTLSTTYAVLQPGTLLGQTFVATQDGLSGIEFNLAPELEGSGEVLLHLRSDPDAQDDLATARLDTQSINSAGNYRFTFDPQEHSRRQYYYAFLEIVGEGRLQVGMAWGGAYLDGAIYQDHRPYNSQMAFSLVYDPIQAALGTGKQVISWIGMLLLAAFLYILPGWALMKGLWRGWEQFSWIEKAVLSAGASLALIPLFFLWTDLVGVHLGRGYAWLPGIAAILVMVWMERGRLRSNLFHWPPWQEKPAWSGKFLPDITIIILILAVFFVRLSSVRNLDLPMWGDSYQHTVITQLMQDRGGLFDSWQPYAPLESLTYHFGFHADAAVFGWLAHLPATRAVIWAGQILNALAVLAVYPFTVRLGGNRWAGVAGVLLGGLLFQMPMEYVNWGRYTQLAGQTILPVFALLFLLAMRQAEHDWKKFVLLAILLSGLALTHYRILIFALAVLPAYMVLELRRKNFIPALTRMAILGAGSFILFLPWFIHVYGARILEILQSQLTTPASANPSGLNEYNAIGDLLAYLPLWAWIGIAVATVAGLALRKNGVAFVALWWLFILLAANPAWLNLPGTGTLSNFAVFIAAYIPAAILIGAGIGWITTHKLFTQRFAPAVLAIIFLGTAWLGVNQRALDVRPLEFALASRPDLHAAAWIRGNIPQDAKFVVNYFFSYIDQLIVGSDGGWWLPLLTERQTNLPPLSYGIEDSSGAEYLLQTNALAQDVQENGIVDPAMIKELTEAGFEYIYVGQRQGQLNNPGKPVLDPEVLRHDAHFQVVYQQDRVWIFKIIP